MKTILCVFLLCWLAQCNRPIPDLEDTLRSRVYLMVTPDRYTFSGVNVSDGRRCLILTAAHAVLDASHAAVRVQSHPAHYEIALTRYVDPEADLALLEMETCTPKRAVQMTVIATHFNIHDKKLFTVSYPRGNRQGTFSTGMYEGPYNGRAIYNDTRIHAGSSGGGVFNTRRELLGIVHGFIAHKGWCNAPRQVTNCFIPTGQATFMTTARIRKFMHEALDGMQVTTTI